MSTLNTTWPEQKLAREILEVVRELPGCTAAEIIELLPHAKPTTLQPLLSKMNKQGWFERSKKVVEHDKRKVKVWTYTANPEPRPEPIHPKLKASTDNTLRQRIRELEAEIAELRAWRVDAEARCPELKVPQVVLEARKLVAATLRADGDPKFASEVEAGRMDRSPIMRVAIQALGGE